MPDESLPPLADDILRGAAAIGVELNLSETQAFYKLEKKILPAWKEGGQWISKRSLLRTHYATPANINVSPPAAEPTVPPPPKKKKLKLRPRTQR